MDMDVLEALIMKCITLGWPGWVDSSHILAFVRSKNHTVNVPELEAALDRLEKRGEIKRPRHYVISGATLH